MKRTLFDLARLGSFALLVSVLLKLMLLIPGCEHAEPIEPIDLDVPSGVTADSLAGPAECMWDCVGFKEFCEDGNCRRFWRCKSDWCGSMIIEQVWAELESASVCWVYGTEIFWECGD